MRPQLQAQALHTCMKPALLRRLRPMPSPPCPGLPHAIIHPSLFRPAMHPPAPRLLFRLLRHDARSASRLHRGSIPGIQRLSGPGRLGRAWARRFLSSRCRCLPRPLDADAEIIHVLSHHPSEPSTPLRPHQCLHCALAFIALSTSPRLHATHPQHHPRTSQGAVLRAGGWEGGRRTSRFASSSSARRRMMCMPRGCGCVRPLGGRRCGCDCGCDCGCGRGWRCDTGMHGAGAGGGPCSVGSMRACPDVPSGARWEEGRWGLRRR
ncbi:hypothetical protein B0H14DRAFT_1535923 [Mycena olivaceomarginata]|nr:hypothetical protein B0H14DRAFT_1535923 [Mycena olivaceomarginata]